MKPDAKPIVDKATQVLKTVGMKGRICSSLYIATKRLASVGAGDIPIAMPLICLTSTSPKCMRLLYMIKSMASRRAFGLILYHLALY
jgi:hypothetical protein